MSPMIRRVVLCIPVLAGLLSTSAVAQFPKVVYELQEGSSMMDGCVSCERATIGLPLSGTFTLQRLPVKIIGELYEVSELNISCITCKLAISGTGRIHRPDLDTITPSFDLSVNGVDGVQLAADNAPAEAPWPVIDITVSEDGSRDPSHQYTLRLVAAPQVTSTPYELVPGDLNERTGSLLEIICPVCRLLQPIIPLEGTMAVGLVDSVIDGLATYRLDGIRMRDTLDNVEYTVNGSGEYQEGGDPDIEKRMRLLLSVNGEALEEFLGGPLVVKAGAGFPTIDLEVEQVEKGNLWYRIQIVAKPSGGSPTFRRGDSNSDGAFDIADPIFHLGWLFSGGPTPACLDASDVDADGEHNLTDAIYSLQHLFLGGPAPPAPGPIDCGPAPTPRFGCATSC